MGLSKLDLLVSLLPVVPTATWTGLMHTLHATRPSKHVDLKTELIVATIRSLLAPSRPRSISSTQKLLNGDTAIKGRIWVSKYTPPAAPDAGARDAVIRAINGLQKGRPDIKPDHGPAGFPDQLPVEAEWIGYRVGADVDSTLPSVSEAQKYAELMKECTSPTTILYLHGGAFWLLDPATYRPTTKRLAKLTGGRCYSIRYRLAPQNAFPAAIIDALASYLTLIYPPPGAFHEAVAPEHIVFAGDRYGVNS